MRASRWAVQQAICDAVSSGLTSEYVDRRKTVAGVMHENVFRRVLVADDAEARISRHSPHAANAPAVNGKVISRSYGAIGGSQDGAQHPQGV